MGPTALKLNSLVPNPQITLSSLFSRFPRQYQTERKTRGTINNTYTRMAIRQDNIPNIYLILIKGVFMKFMNIHIYL